MTDGSGLPEFAVGACGPCRHVFLMTPEAVTCPLCGRAPSAINPFPEAGVSAAPVEVPAAEEPAVEEEPVVITVTCPHCDKLVDLAVTQEQVAVVPSPPAEPPLPPPPPTPAPTTTPS